MNKTVEDFIRTRLIKLLVENCTQSQRDFFKRMYSANNLDLDIYLVVKKMHKDKLDWALSQTERTVENNKSKMSKSL